MIKTKNSVIDYLTTKHPSGILSSLLQTTTTTLIRSHELPWVAIESKKAGGFIIYDKNDKFVLSHKEKYVVDEIISLSEIIIQRYRDEFPDNYKHIQKVWELIKKENQEIEHALKWQVWNMFKNLIIK